VDGFGTVTASTLMAEERRRRLPEVRVSWVSRSLPCLPSPVSRLPLLHWLLPEYMLIRPTSYSSSLPFPFSPSLPY
jgi:hypothetical protein